MKKEKYKRCKECKWILGHDWKCKIHKKCKHIFVGQINDGQPVFQCVKCFSIAVFPNKFYEIEWLKSVKNKYKFI